MALIPQPFRHPDSGIYYLRRRVPDDIRPIIGKTEIRRSLNTRNHQQAKSAFALAYAESERWFTDARKELYGVSSPVEPRPTIEPPLTGPPITNASITLSEGLRRYIQSVAMSGKPKHVLRRHTVDYSRAVNRLITKVGDCPITTIQPSEIHAFAAGLIQPVIITSRSNASASLTPKAYSHQIQASRP